MLGRHQLDCAVCLCRLANPLCAPPALLPCSKLSTVELECPSLTQLLVRDCGFSDPAVLQSLGDTAIAPVLQSDVLDTARQAAQPHKLGLAGSSGSGSLPNPGSTMVLPSSSQGRVRWTAPVVEDADSDGEGGVSGLMSDRELQVMRRGV